MADIDPNLPAAEALGPGQTLEEHYQEKIELYTGRIESDPGNWKHYLGLFAVYLDLGHKAEALESLDELEKGVKDLSMAARALGANGFWQMKENQDWEIGLELYRRAHELQPGNWLYLVGLGNAHFMLGQSNEALAEFTESTKLPGGQNSLSFFWLTVAYAQRGNNKEAVSWYKKAVEQMPADGSRMDPLIWRHLDVMRGWAPTWVDIKTEEETP